jgi:hypothetical protein
MLRNAVSSSMCAVVLAGSFLAGSVAHAAPVAPAVADTVGARGGAEAAQPVRLSGRTLRTWDAPEADQAAIADSEHFYAIDNAVIAKYRLDTGARVAVWNGEAEGAIEHLNSCLLRQAQLWCANSNYPDVPMGSSVEVFDTATMTHVGSHSLGMMDEGSLTWFDGLGEGYIAGFAHYSRRGGVPFKDSSYSSIVRYDNQWRRTGGWLLPEAVIERMAPYAASGGALGPDGLLYLLGHDLPELYVVAFPAAGPRLVHVATIGIDAPGQAFAWADDGSRTIHAIDRKRGKVLAIEVPAVPPSGER